MSNDQSIIDVPQEEKGNANHSAPASGGKSMINKTNDNGFQLQLLQSIHQRIEMKDFASEIRALMDVEEFVHQGFVQLGQKTTQTYLNDKLIEQILLHTSHSIDNHEKFLSRDWIDEARQNLFVMNSTDLLAKVIQPVRFETDSSLDKSHQPDPSWLIAYTSIGQIKKRLMILVQYKPSEGPKYLGANINLLMLIITPIVDKETKSAFEAARTFATLFNSIEQYGSSKSNGPDDLELFEAKTEVVLKACLMLKAKQVFNFNNKSNCNLINDNLGDGFVNRHNYSFSPMISMIINQSSKSTSTSLNSDQLFVIKTRSSSPASNGMNQFQETRASVALTQFDKMKNNDNFKNDNKQTSIQTNDYYHAITSSDANLAAIPNRARNNEHDDELKFGSFGKGVLQDFKARLKCYPSDFKDAFVGPKRTIQKTIATIWFLYFGILLPIIAFNLLNHTQTSGKVGNLRKSIFGQAVGGLIFALLGGQPLVIIMTTAPLCLYTKGESSLLSKLRDE